MIKDKALKLALEFVEFCYRDVEMNDYALEKREETEIAIREALAQTEQINTIRALTEQCATLVWERNDLKKQVQTYEKHGVTCQTYRHKVKASCSECNMNEIYTAQPQQEPVGDMPHGWVLNWPSPNGGTKPVYHASAIKPKFGEELDGKLTMYPVYTRTSPPAQRKPLTDEEIDYWIGSNSTKKALARAIEAAHGIKGDA